MLTSTFTHIGDRDFLCQLDATDLQEAYKYAKEPDPPGSLEFLQAAKQIIDNYRLEMPEDTEEALELYVLLTTIMQDQANSL